MNTIDYSKQAQDILTKHNITFSAVLVGDDCPAFCEDAEAGRDMDKVNVFPRRTHIHGKHYRCTFTAKDRAPLYMDFWNSYADEAHNAKDIFARPKNDRKKRVPTPYDVLACITKSDPGSFENFCGDFGYDSDSRKAESVYRAVVAEWQRVAKFFTAEELAELQEVA